MSWARLHQGLWTGNGAKPVRGRDRRTVLRSGPSGEAILDPGDRVQKPDPDARGVAEQVVLLVVNSCAVLAVGPREGTHVARDHHAIAGADAGLVRRCPFEITVGALPDEQRNCRCTAGAHDELVGERDEQWQTLGSRILGADKVGPFQPPITWLAKDIRDRCSLHVVVELQA